MIVPLFKKCFRIDRKVLELVEPVENFHQFIS